MSNWKTKLGNYGSQGWQAAKPAFAIGYESGRVSSGVAWPVASIVTIIILCLIICSSCAIAVLLVWYRSDVCDTIEGFEQTNQDNKNRN